jgi:Domain of unknown function (DUF4349)
MKSANRFNLALGFTALISSAILASCASAPSVSNAPAPMPLSQPMAQKLTPPTQASPAAAELADGTTLNQTNPVLSSKPQLIKTASLQVTVKSITRSIDQVKAIAQQQQGDILNLRDQIPTDENRHRTASLQIRVPQAKLESALQALKALGDVDSQAVTAEDVSTQLVDFQARLKNLRRTEEMLLEIMGRSGGITEVLQVSQELSSVRSQIEQITAQLTAMQNQVAYSAIHLNLLEVTASVRSQPAVDSQIGNTWESATHSFSKFTVDLLQLGIWLMVYSPYWLVLGAIAAFGYTRFRSRLPQTSEPTQSNET